ncbi:MAG: hypothetical protein KJI72_02165 [Patescibacteria group bacterium]|nr:hypothetical protein [Patescibacteria group bacterium]
MKETIQKVQIMLKLMGFESARVDVDEEHRRMSIFIDDETVQSRIATTLPALEHILNLMVRDEKGGTFVVDLNYYRKERERLIAELARVSAHKAVVTKNEIKMPPMNAYERRLVHLEIATHPELKTESAGIGKERYVVIKHLQ